MNSVALHLAGSSPALHHTGIYLTERGLHILKEPSTRVTHLLLPVPGFDESGTIKGGADIGSLLAALPKNITVLGGNLRHPALEGYHKLDLLQDEDYLAQNAAITADCALGILMQKLPVTLPGCPILIMGWGRIGQCLAHRLQKLSADVTVAARRPDSRAMAAALGFQALSDKMHAFALRRYRVIINTVPVPILTEEQVLHCRPDCIKLDLASVKGIAGSDVIWARGLPGKEVPESSGILIGKTALRLIRQTEVLL